MQHEYVANSSEPDGPTFCFAIEQEGLGRRYACVSAHTMEAAHARIAPLFPECELYLIDAACMAASGA